MNWQDILKESYLTEELAMGYGASVAYYSEPAQTLTADFIDGHEAFSLDMKTQGFSVEEKAKDPYVRIIVKRN